MKNKGIGVVVSVVVVLGLVMSVFGCAKPAEPTPAETIKIACVAPLTGGSADLIGRNAFGGMDLVIKEINDAGGILGRTVEAIKIDEGYTPEETIKSAKEAISYNPDAFIGGQEAGTMDACAPTLRDYERSRFLLRRLSHKRLPPPVLPWS